MSPLQKWMTAHGHPGWYSWLVVIGGCIASMVISVGIAVQMNNAALERDRRERAVADQKALELSERSRAASCAFVRRISDAYQEQRKELSGPGLTIAAAWADLVKECE